MRNLETFNSEFQPESGNRPKEENELLGSKEGDRRSLFRKAYESKMARILVILGMLGIGGKINLAEPQRFSSPAAKHETFERARFELGKLEQKFTSVIEIPNPQNRYILHIGQMHGGNTLEETRRGAEIYDEDLSHIIEKQKDVESLLMWLADKHQVRDVFVEGVDQTLITFIEKIKSHIISRPDGTKNNPPMRWNELMYLSSFASIPQEGLTDQQRAFLLYLATCNVTEEKEKLIRSYHDYQANNGNVLPEYVRLFKAWGETSRLDGIVTSLSNMGKEMAEQDLLKNDRIYIWGGAMKLYLEGKIQVHPAETIESNETAFAKYPGGEMTFTNEQLKDPKRSEEHTSELQSH